MSGISWGSVPLGSVIPFTFGTYDGATGASEAWSGIAVTDIEIYKGTSMTQRSSDAGYVLLDTDGIDLDGAVGIGGFSVDTGDNTDAGFFVAGSFFTVVVVSVTVDAQTVNFVAGTFRLTVADNTAGTLVVDVGRISNDVTAADNAELFFDGTGYAGGTIKIGVDLVQIGGVAQSATDLKDFADDGYDPSTNKVQGVVLTDTLTTYTGNTLQTGDSFARIGLPAGASVSADIAAIEAQTDDIGAAGVGLTAIPWNTNWDAEVQSEVADALAVYDPPTHAELVTEVNAAQTDIAAVQTVVDAVLVDTAEIGAAGAGLTAINLPNQTMDIVGNITGNLSGSVGSVSGAVGSVTGAVGSVTGNVGGNVTGSVGSVVGAVGSVTGAVGSVTGAVGSVTGAVGSVTGAVGSVAAGGIAAASFAAGAIDAAATNNSFLAEVNAEVVDALNVDTYAEPAQGAPGATISLAAKLGFLYKAFRNKKTQTATTFSLMNDDAATVDHKATVSDDGVTFASGEIASGP